MTSFPSLTTKRLLLRQPKASDDEAIADLANNRAVSRNLATMPYPIERADWQKMNGPDSGLRHTA